MTLSQQRRNIARQAREAIREQYGSYAKAKRATGIKSTSQLEAWAAQNLITKKGSKAFKKGLESYVEQKQITAAKAAKAAPLTPAQKKLAFLKSAQAKGQTSAQVVAMTPERAKHVAQSQAVYNIKRGIARESSPETLASRRDVRQQEFERATEGMTAGQVLRPQQQTTTPPPPRFVQGVKLVSAEGEELSVGTRTGLALLRESQEQQVLAGGGEEAARVLEARRQREIKRILETPPAYGTLRPAEERPSFSINGAPFYTGVLKSPSRIAGTFSKATEYAGTQAEYAFSGGAQLYAELAKQPRFADKPFIKTALQGAGYTSSAASGFSQSFVTDVGKNKTEALITVGTFGAGKIIGGVKGYRAASKTLKAARIAEKTGRSSFPKIALRSVGKGTLVAAGTTAIGVSTFQVATSNDPSREFGRQAGGYARVGGAFTAGYKTGYTIGGGLRYNLPSIKRVIGASIRAPAYGLSGSLPGRGSRGAGKVLSKAQRRKISAGRAYNPNIRTRTFVDKEGAPRYRETMFKARKGNIKIKAKKAERISLTESGKSVVTRVTMTPPEVIIGRGYGNASPVKRRFRTSQRVPRPKITSDYLVVSEPSRKVRGFGRETIQVPRGTAVRESRPVRQGRGVLVQLEKGNEDFYRGLSIKKPTSRKSRFPQGDPARSQYAAQNIIKDNKIDVSEPYIYERQQSLRGGFRKGMRERLLVRQQPRIDYLKSELNTLMGAQLPKPVYFSRSKIIYETGGATTPKIKTKLAYRSMVIPKTRPVLKTDYAVSTDYDTSTDLRNSLFSAQAYSQATTPKTMSSVSSALDAAQDTAIDYDSAYKSLTTLKPLKIPSTTRGTSTAPPTPPPIIPPSPPPTIKPPTYKPPRVKPPRRPIVDIPKPPYIPLIDDFMLKKRRRGLFDVFVRKRGKDVKINLKGLSIEKATSRLKGELKSTARASGFLVKKGSGKKVLANLGGGEFRTSKKDPFRTVQRRHRRISSSGEFREITKVGIASQRRRGGFL